MPAPISPRVALPDMASTRTATTRVQAALMLAFGMVAVTQATATAEPAGHQVTYTVTTTSDLMANIQYIQSDPPSQSAFNANSSQYLQTLHTPITGGQPLVYTATLADPGQWALITASGGLRINPEFHCEISVDGEVVVSQQGGSGVTCSTRPW
ncbi:MAG TPA: hypothetical protein VFR17_07890 [Mycobacterium sp.]|nr:hypothetical protein [Mycobacterium sp.]